MGGNPAFFDAAIDATADDLSFTLSLSLLANHQGRLLGSKHKACLRDVVGQLKEALGEDAAEMQELLKDYGLNPS